MALRLGAWIRAEFLTPRRLIFNFLWYGFQIGIFAYGWYLMVSNKHLAGINELGYSVWISRGAGLVLACDCGLILLPMLRNVIRFVRPKTAWLFPADENIWFHRQVAYSIACWSVVHVTAHYVNFINIERKQLRPELAVQIHYTQAGGITGHTMLLIMLLMYTTAHHTIRAECFEAFWYTHHLAFFFFMALFTHATGCFVRDSPKPDYIRHFPYYSTEHCLGYESWRFTVWPFLLYFLERVYREVRARWSTELCQVLVHPSGAMELHIRKPSFKYASGQWLFIQVPDVSQFQWHPFTITSAPDDSFISVHIRQVGDWTKALGDRLGAGPDVVSALTKEAMKVRATSKTTLPSTEEKEVGDPTPFQNGLRGDFIELFPMADPASNGRLPILPRVRIDGPYGAPAEDVFKAEVAVLVGAGIGVTPFASILRHIWYRQTSGRLGSLRRVVFIWVCRDAPSFGWFQSLLKEVELAQVDPDFLRINIYLTQKMNEDMFWNIAINGAEAEYDPLTLLRTRTYYGRPDWKTIYLSLRTSIHSGVYLPQANDNPKVTTVRTFFCGPSVMAKVIQAEAGAASTPSVKFTFFKEHF